MGKGIKIGAVVVGVAVIAVGVTMLDDSSRRRNTAEAPAEILKVQRYSRGGTGSGRRRLRIHYQYQLAGRTIRDTDTASAGASWAPGQAVKVCYDPENPQRHRLERASYRCGS